VEVLGNSFQGLIKEGSDRLDKYFIRKWDGGMGESVWGAHSGGGIRHTRGDEINEGRLGCIQRCLFQLHLYLGVNGRITATARIAYRAINEFTDYCRALFEGPRAVRTLVTLVSAGKVEEKR
jgi:hypothetical protein